MIPTPHKKQPSRDFLFFDEAGDPGTTGASSSYYIQGLVHVTNASLEQLNVHLGAFRYFGHIRRELKSVRLDGIQKEKLADILTASLRDSYFVKASAVYVDKKNYIGPYLIDQPSHPADPVRFQHFVTRRLLEFHFEHTEAQSGGLEE